MNAGAAKLIFQRAKELRGNETHAEAFLWSFLRTKPLGFKFRRQHPYSIYILDFYCHALKLIIEVDGGIHQEADMKESDQVRQRILEQEGLAVVRYTNDDIITNFEAVRTNLEAVIQERQKTLS